MCEHQNTSYAPARIGGSRSSRQIIEEIKARGGALYDLGLASKLREAFEREKGKRSAGSSNQETGAYDCSRRK